MSANDSIIGIRSKSIRDPFNTQRIIEEIGFFLFSFTID